MDLKDDPSIFHGQMYWDLSSTVWVIFLKIAPFSELSFHFHNENTVQDSFYKCLSGNVTASGICSGGLLLKAKNGWE